jgi:hypothetical protein
VAKVSKHKKVDVNNLIRPTGKMTVIVDLEASPSPMVFRFDDKALTLDVIATIIGNGAPLDVASHTEMEGKIAKALI